MKNYSYKIPERKIGDIFTYNGETYQVKDGKSQHLATNSIGCCVKDPTTGKITNLCAFASCCGAINSRHRGFCTPENRKDNKVVYFEKLNELKML